MGAQTEDAWDRLAALAFGGAPSAGGCSEHAHDLECTCLADHEPAAADAVIDDADGRVPPPEPEAAAVPPGGERPAHADSEMDVAD